MLRANEKGVIMEGHSGDDLRQYFPSECRAGKLIHISVRLGKLIHPITCTFCTFLTPAGGATLGSGRVKSNFKLTRIA